MRLGYGRAYEASTVAPSASCAATRWRRTRRSRRRLSAATLVSLYTTFELLRQDPQFHEPAKPAIVVSLLAVTLPLALRRRYPLAVAVRRDRRLRRRAAWRSTPAPRPCLVGVLPDASGPAGSRSTAPSSTAGGARRRRRCSRRSSPLLLAEVVREVLFYKGGRVQGPAAQPGVRARLQRRVHRASRCCSASPSARCASASASWPRRRASCSASGRRTPAAPSSKSACASPASCTTSSPTTSASWASRPARRAA